MSQLRQRKQGKKSAPKATADEFCPEVVQSNASGFMSSAYIIGLVGALGLVWFYANGGDTSALLSRATSLFQAGPPTVLNDIGSDKYHLDAKKMEEIDCTKRFPLFEVNPRLKRYNWTITTNSPLAQEYFNEGALIAAGFVHDEARRSFRAAIEQDPKCAMCFWGVAYVTSVDINRPLTQAWLDEARGATKQAVKLTASGTYLPFERALIHAMNERYPDERTLENGAEYEQKYADSMKMVADLHKNGNILSMYCESLMNTMPWAYWKDRDTPKELTRECLRSLDEALELEPENLLALHLYIHIYEYSNTLDIPEKKADVLAKLIEPTPSLGHLTHMPGHIFQRVGRHVDAINANVRAWNVAEPYFKKCNVRPDGGYNAYYAMLYYPHRHAFALYSSVMSAQKNQALQIGLKMYKDCKFQMENMPWFHMYSAYPEMINVRFGDWKAVLATPIKAPHSTDFAQAMRYMSHAIAHIGLNQCDKAQEVYKVYSTLAADEQFRDLDVMFAKAGSLLDVADATYKAKYASKCDDNKEKAVEFWTEASVGDDNLPYIEPPYWYYNVRSCLGQELLDMGKFAEAEKVFKEDLVNYQNNGWSLKGLELALKGQNVKGKRLADVQAQVRKQWYHMDAGLNIDVACY